ncbi:MAG TPA: iron-sulfur cluster assembly protein [bacterium]|jgi:FeS assembly SUF system protein|nr:iron-sulfur cluster assembly protein [bacterium]HOZ21098.1 iron-sulfur cluster assembly protein [bacterium]
MVEMRDTDELMDKVVLALREVYDPEIPVNIYDLGLVYEIAVNELGRVDITMTLTSPMCPVAETLPGEVRKRLEEIPEVREAAVAVTWEPPWEESMMTEEARLELGLF